MNRRALDGGTDGVCGVVADVYHGDDDTEAVWANFPNQKGLVERECLRQLWETPLTGH